MDAELKAKWIAALRSGEYQQCAGDLYRDGRYCCLGVLHKLITGKTPPARWDAHENQPKPAQIVFDYHDLADMNDGIRNYAKHSFSEIADYIEKSL